jgi:hypothetical protein
VPQPGGTTREAFMPILNVLIALVVVGVILWLVNTYIPMDGKIKSILNVVIVIAVIVWLLQVFGVMGGRIA